MNSQNPIEKINTKEEFKNILISLGTDVSKRAGIHLIKILRENKIAQLRSEGIRIRDLVKIFDLNKREVKRIIKNKGINSLLITQKATEERNKTIIEIYKQGIYNYTDIGEMAGLTATMVRFILEKAGVTSAKKCKIRAHRGNKHSRSKLRAKFIPDIRKRLASGESCGSIARLYAVDQRAISQIKHGKTWKHIKEK